MQGSAADSGGIHGLNASVRSDAVPGAGLGAEMVLITWPIRESPLASSLCRRAAAAALRSSADNAIGRLTANEMQRNLGEVKLKPSKFQVLRHFRAPGRPCALVIIFKIF